VFDLVEEGLQHDVGALDQADPAADRGRQSDHVAPEGRTVALEVVEDQVDGLAQVLGWTALRTTLPERDLQLLDSLLDVADLGRLLLGVGRDVKLVGGRFALEAKGVAEFIKEA
jgi:hypothetical protein